MTKEQLMNFKWQPPPQPPPPITPRDIYVVRPKLQHEEEKVWAEIEKTLEGYEIVDFRPSKKGDTALYYGNPAAEVIDHPHLIRPRRDSSTSSLEEYSWP